MVELNPKFYEYNGWSFSRSQLYNKCQRAYFFQYIAGYIQRPTQFDTFLISRLKKDLISKIFLQGKLIHHILENQIGQHKLGRDLNEKSAIGQYTLNLKKYQEVGKDIITEFYNGEPLDNAFFDKIRDSGIKQIQTFFNVIWPIFNELDYVEHENKNSFKLGDIRVFLRPDYVSKTKTGIFVVSDWKTGSDREDYDNDKQLAVYVLWAMYNYEIEPDNIRSELIYLSTGNSRSFSFKYEDLEKTIDFINQNFQCLNKDYEIASFEPKASEANCISCNYAKICDCKKLPSTTNIIGGLLVPKDTEI